MMTNEESQPPPPDTTKYEVEQAHLDRDDVLATASLFNIVGSELTQVDKQSVSGSTQKATRLDESKVFNKQQPMTPQQQVLPPPPQPPAPVAQAAPPPQPMPPVSQVAHAQSMPAMISVDNSEILSKIDDMGKKVDALYDVYNKLLDKISKGTKRMTLTINDKD